MTPDANGAVGSAGLHPDPLILDHAFSPRHVAIAGASANRAKWANILFRRLIDGPFRGTVSAINPRHRTIEGRPCYPSVDAVPNQIDYLQVLVRREQVPDLVRSAAAKSVPVVHVLSSGFGEVGGAGPELERALLDALAGSRTRLIGPNSLGLYSARAGLDFSKGCHFQPGSITFVSQSGALATDVLALGQARGLAFGKILSVGNCCDLDWPDYARYCRHDPETDIAVFYVESVRDGRALFEELRALTSVKPVLLLKGGRTAQGARSVVSHTGRLAGDHAIWQAMMRQAGVIALDDVEDLLLSLQAHAALAAWPGARRGGLMVIGSGGGVSVLATDAAEAAGLHLAELDTETLGAMTAEVSDAAELGGVGNPVEMPVDRLFGSADTLARLIGLAASDPGVGAVLLHINLIALANQFSEEDGTAWTEICDALVRAGPGLPVPLAVVLRNGDCAMTRALRSTGLARLKGLPVFEAIGPALGFLRRYRQLAEAPQ